MPWWKFNALLVCCSLQFNCLEAQNTWLLTNARVVDVQQGVLISPPQDLLIEAGSITDMVPTGSREWDQGLYQLNVQGKYLIPGMWDMHAHPDDPEVWRMHPVEAQRDLLMPQFVLQGVTGIRDMAGSMQVVQRWRKLGEEGRLLVPKIMACGPLLDGPNPMWDGSVGIADESQVPKVVDSLKAAGSDFLKVYSLLPRDLYFAVVEYAAQVAMPVVGHVPFEVLPSEAAAGLQSQEHLLEILLECSSRREDIKKGHLNYGNVEDRFDRYIFRQNLIMDTFDESQWRQLIQVYVKNQTWHTPTLSMWFKNAWFEREVQKDRDLWGFLPGYLQKYWTPEHNDHLKYRDNQDFLNLKKRLYGFYEKLTIDLYQSGIKLLAGTDVGANPLCWPGIGVHNELQALVAAGLTPAAALQTATCNPAQFLELEEYGTVAVNNIADLVILEENPLLDIQNTRKIWGVVMNGVLIGPEQRRQMLQEIKDKLVE